MPVPSASVRAPGAASAAAWNGSQITQASTAPRSNAARASAGAKNTGSTSEYLGFFQRLHQQIVNIGALVQRHLLAPEIGHRSQLAVLGHKNSLALRRGGLVGDILDRGAPGLREDRRRLAGIAEIDRPDCERFEPPRD